MQLIHKGTYKHTEMLELHYIHCKDGVLKEQQVSIIAIEGGNVFEGYFWVPLSLWDEARDVQHVK